MLRSIYERIVSKFRASRRRPAPRRARLRPLAIESLEGRELLTTATLTFNSISDGSFEAPKLPAGAYQLAPAAAPWQFAGVTYQVPPSSSPWQFAGDAGVSSNGSAFTNGNPNAPDGTQVAFIQDNGSISQTVYLDAGVYNLSFLAAQRLDYQTQNQGIKVLIDGALEGMIVPNSPVVINNATKSVTYSAYQTWNFTVTAGTHSVELLGTSPPSADSTVFIDEVTITPVQDSLADGGFEEPALAANAYAYAAGGAAWQFSTGAGISRNGSDFATDWKEAQNAPAGAQVAFIQGQGNMSQSVYLDAGTYQLAMLAAQRAIFQAHYQTVEILVDGAPQGVIDPVNTEYSVYQSSTFTVAAGMHVIEFLGLNPLGGDNTAFIDQVVLSANAIADGSFESPALSFGTYQPAPPTSPISPWLFSPTTGMSQNDSGITSGNPNAPDGGQVAYIQGHGVLSQSVDLIAGSYYISFQAAQRVNGQTKSQQLEVLVDGAQVDLITPVSANYSLFDTSSFTVGPGTHNVQFIGMDPQAANCTVLIDEVALTATNDEISDGGFEAPILPANSYQVAPGGTPWAFSPSAGMSANGSGLTSGSANAPQGAQVGYLSDNGTISQTVYLDADTYDLSFLAAQRAIGQTKAQQIQVLVDGAQVGLITPSSNTYTLYQTWTFTVADGVHVIEFQGMSPPTASSTALIDGVNLVAVHNTIGDGGFEAPVLTTGSYAVGPAGSAWQFSGLAGLTTNDSGFTIDGANAPQGAQVAFLQNGGGISQSVDLDAGTYNISFLATQRENIPNQNQQIRVLVDSAQVALITPTLSSIISGGAITYTYAAYQTSNFTVGPGAHVVQFVGMAPPTGDNTAFIDDVTLSAGCALSDDSFEQPALAATTYQTAPGGTSWAFSPGLAGVSANGSAFTAGNANAPDGAQVAFIKDTGWISQSVYLADGYYNVSFLAAQRDHWQTQYQTLEVLVDGNVVGTATPAGTSYGLYQTSDFSVTTAGMHTIKIVGLNPLGGDNTALIDDVVLDSGEIP
jgi:hypothetical protein